MSEKRSHEEIGREIDNAKPSEELKKAVAADLDAHLPADRVPGQSAQEPLKKSQKQAQDEEPGAL